MINDMYDTFEDLCYLGQYNEIHEYIDKHKINVNINDGFLLNVILSHNDLKLLKLFIDYGADISINNYCCVRMIAHCGYTNLLSYILDTFDISHEIFSNNTSLRNNSEAYKIIQNNFN